MYGVDLSGGHSHAKYGFANEHEIRIATGIKLMFALTGFFLVLFHGAYREAIFFIFPLWFDFILQVFVGPQYSLFGAFVRFFLRREPQWVGAVQKRFAWIIGLVLSTLALVCLIILAQIFPELSPKESKDILIQIQIAKSQGSLLVSPMTPPLLLCGICIIFMWLESIVGYCVGCHLYGWLVKKGWMPAHKGQTCPNGECSL